MSGSIPPNIHHVGETTTTMQVARDMLAAANGAPFAVLAESQSQGRGTTGRTWASPKGNMYFTLCVPEKHVRKEILPILPLLNGLVCTAAIKSLVQGASVHVKWPNDVIYNGKKVGGSIVESEGDFLLLGIGVNVAVAPPVTDDGRVSACVGDIAAALGQPTVTPVELAESVWNNFFAMIGDPAVTREEVVRRFDAAMDRSLELHRRTATGRDPEPLRAVSLNEWGHLTVVRPDGSQDTLMADYLF